MDDLNKYKQYAMDVITGNIISCNYIKQACQRYLEFFHKYEFRPDKVDKVVNFIQKLKHFTGKHNGKNFILQPWQVWIVSAIFGFYYIGTDKRVTRTVYIEIARKNGKTAFVAALQLYMLIADGENGAECDFLANNAKQAKIAYDMASNFLQSIDARGKYFKRYRDIIKFDKTKSFIQVLSSEASGLDGFNAFSWVLDECHEQKDSRLYDVMVSSQGMRQNPMGIIITTAGFNQFGFCYPYRKTCTEIISGAKEDDSQFSAIFTLDEEDDWTDESTWIKANPNLGITVQTDYIKDQINKAKINPSLEVGVKTKNLNIWCNSADIWINNDLILSVTKNLNLHQFPEETFVYIGIDLASVSDLTAMSVMIPHDGKFYFATKYYLPESCLCENSNAELYKNWKNQGYLTVTPGNVTDYDYVTKDILVISKYFIIDKIAYDAYNSTQWAINATAEGLPLEPYSQALWNFNKPTKELERLIKMNKVVIDNNPITRWCFSNVCIKEDHNENIKPVKVEKQNKIDGVIAMIEALGIYLETPQYQNVIG